MVLYQLVSDSDSEKDTSLQHWIYTLSAVIFLGRFSFAANASNRIALVILFFAVWSTIDYLFLFDGSKVTKHFTYQC
jgi:hypothetical protein